MNRADIDHANMLRLKACPGPHLFGLVHGRGEVSSRARYVCERCSGSLNEDSVAWYKRGLADGLGHAEQRFNALKTTVEAALCGFLESLGWRFGVAGMWWWKAGYVAGHAAGRAEAIGEFRVGIGGADP